MIHQPLDQPQSTPEKNLPPQPIRYLTVVSIVWNGFVTFCGPQDEADKSSNTDFLTALQQVPMCMQCRLERVLRLVILTCVLLLSFNLPGPDGFGNFSGAWTRGAGSRLLTTGYLQKDHQVATGPHEDSRKSSMKPCAHFMEQVYTKNESTLVFCPDQDELASPAHWMVIALPLARAALEF